MSGIRPESYEILIIPLHYKDIYDDVIEVTRDFNMSDYIEDNGVGVIKKEIDTGNFDFGTFVFDNVKLKGINRNGKLSFINKNARSIFRYSRDLAKVQINYYDGVSNTPYVRFKGLINEDGSTQDFKDKKVTFEVLSLASIMRKTIVTGGQISNNILFSTAIKRLINIPEITDLLTYNASNIDVQYDDYIDDGSYFDGLTTKEALDQLLLVSNSILIVDDDLNLIVKGRTENLTTHNFYGAGDYYGRENIIDIKDYNDGLQRAFNSVKIGDIQYTDEIWQTDYGIRQKDFDAEFITDNSVLRNVAKRLVTLFKVPKPELEMVVKTKDAKEISILDRVRVTYPLRYKPPYGKKMRVYNRSEYNDSETPYPEVYGDLRIDESEKWIVIGIYENTKDFTTTLKLRQAGAKNFKSGFFGYDASYSFMDGQNYTFMDGTDYEYMEAV